MRALLLAASILAAFTGVASEAAAQAPGGRSDADKAKNKKEWETPTARLEGQRNAGPCPFVKVLYDAGRSVEFVGGREAAGSVAWTGEIQGVEADCRYQGTEPITVNMDVTFVLGRGPMAKEQAKQYRWWVAVTERNRAVLAKEYLGVDAQFGPGVDRLVKTERLGSITIPRKDIGVSGANFEILVGFDVTPEMAAFNRDGKRFRVNAGQTATAATGQTAAR
jgi:hypothetical protein